VAAVIDMRSVRTSRRQRGMARMRSDGRAGVMDRVIRRRWGRSGLNVSRRCRCMVIRAVACGRHVVPGVFGLGSLVTFFGQLNHHSISWSILAAVVAVRFRKRLRLICFIR